MAILPAPPPPNRFAWLRNWRVRLWGLIAAGAVIFGFLNDGTTWLAGMWDTFNKVESSAPIKAKELEIKTINLYGLAYGDSSDLGL